MSKKTFSKVLDLLITENYDSATTLMNKYITGRSASILRTLREEESPEVFVIDWEEENSFITKCDNIETAKLLVDCLEELNEEETGTAQFEIVTSLPAPVAEKISEVEPCTAEDIEDSTDILEDTSEFTIKVPNEDLQEQEDLEEDIEVVTIVHGYTSEAPFTQIERILAAYADEFDIDSEDQDEISFYAVVEDETQGVKLVRRLEQVGISEVEWSTISREEFEEIRSDIGQIEDTEDVSAIDDLNAFVVPSAIVDIDDFPLEEGIQMEPVKNPELSGEKYIGASKTKTPLVNNTSPIVQDRKKQDEAEPVQIISDDYNSYERQKAPKAETPIRAKNQKTTAFDDWKKVSASDSSGAILNKPFPKDSTKSPLNPID